LLNLNSRCPEEIKDTRITLKIDKAVIITTKDERIVETESSLKNHQKASRKKNKVKRY